MKISNIFNTKSRQKRRYIKKNRAADAESLDALKCYLDFPKEIVDAYHRASITDEYWKPYKHTEPKISICIATFNRCKLLTERAIQSIRDQSYSNWEIKVVGDCCTDSTETTIKKIKDDRIEFVNLPDRSAYPEKPELRWMVAGSTPMNIALDMCQGDFISHLDDDDEFVSNRLEILCEEALKSQCEFLWHPFLYETESGIWELNNAWDMKLGAVTTSSVFYHHWFSRIKWDLEAWRLHEPGDWNRFRKIKYLNVSRKRIDNVLLKHHKERNQKS